MNKKKNFIAIILIITIQGCATYSTSDLKQDTQSNASTASSSGVKEGMENNRNALTDFFNPTEQTRKCSKLESDLYVSGQSEAQVNARLKKSGC